MWDDITLHTKERYTLITSTTPHSPAIDLVLVQNAIDTLASDPFREEIYTIQQYSSNQSQIHNLVCSVVHNVLDGSDSKQSTESIIIPSTDRNNNFIEIIQSDIADKIHVVNEQEQITEQDICEQKKEQQKLEALMREIDHLIKENNERKSEIRKLSQIISNPFISYELSCGHIAESISSNIDICTNSIEMHKNIIRKKIDKSENMLKKFLIIKTMQRDSISSMMKLLEDH